MTPANSKLVWHTWESNVKLSSVPSLLLVIGMSTASFAADAIPPALNFRVRSLEGKEVNLADYRGRVLLVVNVASECGATPQYADLEQLYRRYKERGLVVLGFPCNQFGGQEPGTAEQIRSFCTREYDVTFPMFTKIEVNGENAAPFYQHLTSAATQPKGAGKVAWNFEKFLLARDGRVAARFGTGVEPFDPQLVGMVEKLLAE